MNTVPARDSPCPPRHQAPTIEGARLVQLILDMGFGGAERLAQNIAIAMRREGARSHIVCFDAISDNVEPLRRHDIPIELIKRRQTAFDPLTAMRLVRRLKALNARLLHAHDLSSLAYGVVAGTLLGIPVVMTEHSRHVIDARRIRRLEKRLLCLGVSKVVEVSPELAKASIVRDGMAADKVTVIENGVDIERFAATDGRALRQELGLLPGEILVGMVGRLEAIKGPDVLLEAFAGLADRFPGTFLVFAGEGGLKESLGGRAEALGLARRVRFLGSRSDVPDIMAGLDVLVLPSRSEGLPFALLEGMAAGRAVVATTVGQMPPILAPEKAPPNGLLVPPDDPEALAAALSALLEAPPLRRDLGQAARNHVAGRYEQRTMCAAYRDIYLQALAERPCT